MKKFLKWFKLRKLVKGKKEGKRFLTEKEVEAHKDFFEVRNFIEQQIDKQDYVVKGIYGTFAEYIEMIIQMGFCIMFVVAFPWAPLLAAIQNIIGIQNTHLIFIKFI